MLPEQLPHFIKTDTYNGLNFDAMMKIRDYFKITATPDCFGEIYLHDNMFGFHRRRNFPGE